MTKYDGNNMPPEIIEALKRGETISLLNKDTPKQKYCDLEYAKKLKEAGIVIDDSERVHIDFEDGSYETMNRVGNRGTKHSDLGKDYCYPAPDSDELLEWLRSYIETGKIKYWLEIQKEEKVYNCWYINRNESEVLISFENTFLVNALADLAVWVKINKEKKNDS